MVKLGPRGLEERASPLPTCSIQKDIPVVSGSFGMPTISLDNRAPRPFLSQPQFSHLQNETKQGGRIVLNFP